MTTLMPDICFFLFLRVQKDKRGQVSPCNFSGRSLSLMGGSIRGHFRIFVLGNIPGEARSTVTSWRIKWLKKRAKRGLS